MLIFLSGDQYVLIAARPGTGQSPILAAEAPPEALVPKVERFAQGVAGDVAAWLWRQSSWLPRVTTQGATSSSAAAGVKKSASHVARGGYLGQAEAMIDRLLTEAD